MEAPTESARSGARIGSPTSQKTGGRATRSTTGRMKRRIGKAIALSATLPPLVVPSSLWRQVTIVPGTMTRGRDVAERCELASASVSCFSHSCLCRMRRQMLTGAVNRPLLPNTGIIQCMHAWSIIRHPWVYCLTTLAKAIAKNSHCLTVTASLPRNAR